MPLTPADIHNTAFKRPPIGKRGYDEEEVDAFLDEVEQELTRLMEDNRSLQDQLRRGGGGNVGGGNGPSPAALGAELADLNAQLERLQEARARAEQNARTMQAQLERARSTPAAAPVSASPGGEDRTSRVLLMAQRTADEHMRDAQRESEETLANARAKSEQLTTEAAQKADGIEGDARRNHTEAMNRLVTDRANMLDEIERLDQLARGYQQALNDHVSQQLQELNSSPDLPV